MFYFAAFAVALAMTITIIPPLIKISGNLRLLDQPNERKVHHGAVPRVGGVGMVLAAFLPIVLWSSLDIETLSILAGIAILFVFGIWDDRGDLDYRLKFLGQIAAALSVVIYGGVVIDVVPFFGIEPVSHWLSIPLTVLVIVAVTNSVNLADGLDGLAAGIMLLTLAGVALLAHLSDGSNVLLITLVIMGVIVGFLRFNTFPARIFMGDTGSQFLGFTAVTLLILLTQKVNPVLNPALPLFLLGVPLFDTAFVMLKRLYMKKSPFVADRNHIHHQLLALRFDHYEAVVIIYFVQALFVGGGLIMRYYSDLMIVVTWVLVNSMLAFILILAGRNHWYIHRHNYQSYLAKIVNSAHSQVVYKWIALFITFSVVAGLVVGPMLTNGFDRDFGLAAALLFLLLFFRLILGYRFWLFPLRLIIFVTIAFILYMVDNYPSGQLSAHWAVQYLYFGTIVMALLIASRFTIDDAFITTPMDFLLILLIAGLVFIPQAHFIEEYIIHLIIKMFIMFYAVEFALRNMKNRLNSLTISTLLALGLITFKGLVVQ